MTRALLALVLVGVGGCSQPLDSDRSRAESPWYSGKRQANALERIADSLEREDQPPALCSLPGCTVELAAGNYHDAGGVMARAMDACREHASAAISECERRLEPQP